MAVAWHAVQRAEIGKRQVAIVIGCGPVGLGVILMLKAKGVKTVVASDFSPGRRAAATACGADAVIRPDPSNAHFAALAEASGSRVVGRKRHQMLNGGFPYVIEAVGVASSVTEALRCVDNRGAVLLLGAIGTSEVDLSPVWWKEAALVGAINHSWDRVPGAAGAGGTTAHSEALALDILAAGGLPHDAVVTHEFELADYRTAIDTAMNRAETGSIKVVFRPHE